MYAILSTMTELGAPSPAAVAAIRAWYRLDRAFAAVNRDWLATEQVSGEQVAIARIVGERESWPLADLRARLSMHPATLGQTLARLATRGLVDLAADPADRRRRQVALTADGRALLARLPLVGPVRLRSVPAPDDELAALATAFDRALVLFGLEPWADDDTRVDGART